MKKIYLLLTGTLFLLPLSSHAEQITGTINYNPARMGVFDFLKVKDEAFARNYVKAGTMNLNGLSQDFVGQNSFISVENISGAGSITFPYATFTGNTTAGANPADFGDFTNGSPSHTAFGKLELLGGSVIVGMKEDRDARRRNSYINTITNVGKLRIYAGTLLSTHVHVAGDNADDRPRYSFLQDGGTSESRKDYGLVLGGINIPYPAKFSTTPQYVWGEVTLGNSKKAKVLMLQSTASAQSDGCTNGTKHYCPDGVTVEEECVSGNWVTRATCLIAGKKKYITYPFDCAHSWTYGDDTPAPCIGQNSSGWCAGEPHDLNSDMWMHIHMSWCNLVHESITGPYPNYGIMNVGTENASLHQCTPGGECGWCEVGKIYALDSSSYSYCTSACSSGYPGFCDGSGVRDEKTISFRSAALVQCVEQSDPPVQKVKPQCDVPSWNGSNDNAHNLKELGDNVYYY